MRKGLRRMCACLAALMLAPMALVSATLVSAALVSAALAPAALAVTVIAPGGAGLSDRLHEARRQIGERALGRYGMVPVHGGDIADGSYPVAVESTSPFFRITEAVLYVGDGEMRAEITIGSLSYSRVYMGAAEAAADDPDGWIEGKARGGATVFSIPVPALNAAFDCAAYSIARERWYDRQLLIDASGLPEGALGYALPDYELIERAIRAYPDGREAEEAATDEGSGAPEAVELDLPDGEYAIEVNLAGGSGRASVSSPAMLRVRDGRAYASLLWSSAYYDYMLLDGARYENQTADGGSSSFEIPITAMDAPVPVIADTTAMGDPIEISYTLTFYSETVGDRSRVPQVAARQVLLISLAIIVLGGALNYFVKRRRK